jgi:hypothetical protein
MSKSHPAWRVIAALAVAAAPAPAAAAGHAAQAHPSVQPAATPAEQAMSSDVEAAQAPVGARGYRMLGADGRIWCFGDLLCGSTAIGREGGWWTQRPDPAPGPIESRLVPELAASPAVAIAGVRGQPAEFMVATANGNWAQIFAQPAGQRSPMTSSLQYVQGGALRQTQLPELRSGETVVAVVPLTGSGPIGSTSQFWLFTSRGRVISMDTSGRFPPASPWPTHGDLADFTLNASVIGAVPTPTNGGYWMVASDGGIFAFGDARFFGSMGGRPLNEPVVTMVPTSTNLGYWLIAADGGVFAFGDAGFRGSIPGELAPGQRLNRPVVGGVANGDGYLLVASDGGIFSFSAEPFFGSLGGSPPSTPIVAVMTAR